MITVSYQDQRGYLSPIQLGQTISVKRAEGTIVLRTDMGFAITLESNAENTAPLCDLFEALNKLQEEK